MRLPSPFLARLSTSTTSPFATLLPTHAAAIAAVARCNRPITAAGQTLTTSSFASVPLPTVPGATSAVASVSSANGSKSTAASAAAAPGVFGVGVDIAHIPRFERILQRHGARFLVKALHPAEIAQFSRLMAGGDKSAAQKPVAADSAATAAGSSAASASAASSVHSVAGAAAATFVSASSSTTRLNGVTFVASRWAAKEAMVKATGKRLLFPEMRIARESHAGATGQRRSYHSGSRSLESYRFIGYRCEWE